MTEGSSWGPGTGAKGQEAPRDHNDASTEELVSTINNGGGGFGGTQTKTGKPDGSKWASGGGEDSTKGAGTGEEEEGSGKAAGTKIHEKLSRTRKSGMSGPLAPGKPEQEGTEQWEGSGGGYAHGSAAAGSMTTAQDDEDEDLDDEESILGALRWKWYLILLALAVFVLGGIYMGSLFSGGGSDEQVSTDGAQSGGNAGNGAEAGAVQGGAGLDPIPAEDAEDTGLVFEERVEDDGDEVTLLAGDMAWRGEAETVEEGEVLTFEGPTAAQFRIGFELPEGSVHTGVFAVAEPGEPVLHATYHRIDAAGEERTTGDYFVTADEIGGEEEDSGLLLAEGSYVDERTGDGEQVIRTYTERSPRTGEASRYAVSFQAPEGTPIPYLVGWNPSGGGEGSAEEG